MDQNIITFLSEMAMEILTKVGVAYISLIILIIIRAGRLRGLNADNMAKRLGDLCFDTIKEQINKKIEELLQLYPPIVPTYICLSINRY